MLISPKETILNLAARAREKRLAYNLTQAGLEQRSGVSLGSIKLFERTGKISLESLVKIAIALNTSDGLDQLFAETGATSTPTIDELLRQAEPKKPRQRGRVT